jgi:hypothetical protein
MDAQEIAHHFAAENYGPRGTRKAGNVWTQEATRTLYSYAAPIARHTGNPALPVLITSRSYSVTTTRHTTDARRALHHLRPFSVYNPAAASAVDHAENLRHLYQDAQQALRTATETRRRPETRAAAIRHAAETHARAETYRRAFKIPVAGLPQDTKATRDTCRRIDPDQLDAAAAVIAQADAATDRRRAAADKARARRITKQEEENNKTRAAWIAGEAHHYPREHYGTPARLRVKGNAVETSHGARVHVRAAARLWPIAERARQNGTTYRPEPPHRVGPYRLDEVSPEGVRIGCHFIVFEEMQRVRAEVMAAAEKGTSFEDWKAEHGSEAESKWQRIQDEYGDAGPMLSEYLQQCHREFIREEEAAA